MESSLLRAQKVTSARGEQNASVMLDAARVLIADAAERVEHEARRALAAVHSGDMLTTQMGAEAVHQARSCGYDRAAPAGRGGGAVGDRYPSKAAKKKFLS